jgi:hypothetical protein
MREALAPRSWGLSASGAFRSGAWISDLAQTDEDQQQDHSQKEARSAVIAGSVKQTASGAANTTKKHDNQNSEQSHAECHQTTHVFLGF